MSKAKVVKALREHFEGIDLWDEVIREFLE